MRRVLRRSHFSCCRSNEVNYRWVADEPWSFITTFNADTSKLAAHIDLALMGVDTAAKVLINGQLVAQLSNAFRYSGSIILLVVVR